MLYLCGNNLENISSESTEITSNNNTNNNNINNENINNKILTVNSFSSSFMFSIDLTKDPLTMSYEVNSSHLHYYPSLSILRSEYIIVISGYKSKKCEYYSISNKRWKDLPDIPEERYGTNILIDNTSNLIYLLGGFNEEKGENCLSILKLNVNSCIKWDTILISKNEEDLIKKNFCSVIKKLNGKFLILGGKDNFEKPCSDIIEVDIKSKHIHIQNYLNDNVKIGNNVYFKSLRMGIEYKKNYFLFDDEEEKIYKIDEKYSNVILLNNSDKKI